MNVLNMAQLEQNFPVAFTSEKYHSLRFCIDYQNLRAVTLNGVFSIFGLDQRIDSFCGVQVLSNVFARSVHLKMELDYFKHYMMSFMSLLGLYIFIRILSAQTNSRQNSYKYVQNEKVVLACV